MFGGQVRYFIEVMAKWYDKYLTIYDKPFESVSPSLINSIRSGLRDKQSDNPLISVVVIAHNEERHLSACIWSLSDIESQYPIEIIGVNNNSDDETEKIFQQFGLPYFNETKQSPGYARQCGLNNSKGMYHFFIDADTCYPSGYIDLMMTKLSLSNVSCVGAFWSFIPDDKHTRYGLLLYENIRDFFLWIQHFKRPELCIRGMVFAFNAEYARHVKIRTDIRRGEDGSLALSLKKYGKIVFLYHRKARPITGYGTIGHKSIWKSLVEHARVQGKGLSRIFYKKEHYEDNEDNLIK